MREKTALFGDRSEPSSPASAKPSLGWWLISLMGRPRTGECFLSICLSETFLANQGVGKAGGEQWNALSCLPLTQRPAEVTQRVILKACGARGAAAAGGG